MPDKDGKRERRSARGKGIEWTGRGGERRTHVRVQERERRLGSREGERKRRGGGLFHSSGREKKRMEKRQGARGGGVRGAYSGTGSLSAVSLTMLYKAKVAADFRIHCGL